MDIIGEKLHVDHIWELKLLLVTAKFFLLPICFLSLESTTVLVFINMLAFTYWLVSDQTGLRTIINNSIDFEHIQAASKLVMIGDGKIMTICVQMCMIIGYVINY